MKDHLVIISLSIMVALALFIQEPTRFLDPGLPTVSEQLADLVEDQELKQSICEDDNTIQECKERHSDWYSDRKTKFASHTDTDVGCSDDCLDQGVQHEFQ